MNLIGASAPTTVRDQRAPYQNTPRMIATKKTPAAIMSNPPMIFLLRVPLRCWRRGSYLGDRILSVVRIH